MGALTRNERDFTSWSWPSPGRRRERVVAAIPTIPWNDGLCMLMLKPTRFEPMCCAHGHLLWQLPDGEEVGLPCPVRGCPAGIPELERIVFREAESRMVPAPRDVLIGGRVYRIEIETASDLAGLTIIEPLSFRRETQREVFDYDQKIITSYAWVGE